MERLTPISIGRTLYAKLQISPPIQKQSTIQAIELIQKLSFSHFAELIVLSGETKRLFNKNRAPPVQLVGTRTEAADRQPLL